MSKFGEGFPVGRIVTKLEEYGNFGLSILTQRFTIPKDAATRRTPESEEPDMVPLIIPGDYEVQRLIRSAQADEQMLDLLINRPASSEDVNRYMAQIVLLRTKAIAIHLGIER